MGYVPYVCQETGKQKRFCIPSCEALYCIGAFLTPKRNAEYCDLCEQLLFEVHDNWDSKRKRMPMELRSFLTSFPSMCGIIKQLNQVYYSVGMRAAAFVKNGCLGQHVHIGFPTEESYRIVKQSFVRAMVRKRTTPVELIVHQYIDCDMSPLNVKRMVVGRGPTRLNFLNLWRC
jgi:hypothetical protein